MRSVILAAAIAAALLTPPALGQTASPARPVTATLDLSQPGAIGDNVAADSFFAQLNANNGQIIYLDLTILPAQTPGEPGYQLRPLGADTDIRCGPGTGTFGTIRNLQSPFTLNFNHPDNFHSPTTIYIGNRLTFPQHHIACRLLEDMGVPYTPLRILGHFVVAAAAIPTAMEFTLFPVRP